LTSVRGRRTGRAGGRSRRRCGLRCGGPRFARRCRSGGRHRRCGGWRRRRGGRAAGSRGVAGQQKSARASSTMASALRGSLAKTWRQFASASRARCRTSADLHPSSGGGTGRGASTGRATASARRALAAPLTLSPPTAPGPSPAPGERSTVGGRSAGAGLSEAAARAVSAAPATTTGAAGASATAGLRGRPPVARPPRWWVIRMRRAQAPRRSGPSQRSRVSLGGGRGCLLQLGHRRRASRLVRVGWLGRRRVRRRGHPGQGVVFARRGGRRGRRCGRRGGDWRRAGEDR